MNKIEIDLDKLEWWAQPLVLGIMLAHNPPSEEELKRYAELAKNNESQELKDKKLLG